MPARLDRAYREVQAAVHPGPLRRRQARRSSVPRCSGPARVNEAYQTLQDPLERAAYLLPLHGIDVDGETDDRMPRDFLMQQMEWREAARRGARGRRPAIARSCTTLLREVRARQAHAMAARAGALLDPEQAAKPARHAGARAHVPGQARPTRRIELRRPDARTASARWPCCRSPNPAMSAAPHQHRLAVGIDLGTTNSLVATVRSGVAGGAARRARPRAAALGRALPRRRAAARSATRRRRADADDPQQHHRLGQALHGPRRSRDVAHARSCPTTSSTRRAWCSSHSRRRARVPVEVSAEILAALRQRAEAVAGRRTGRRGDHRAGLLRRRAAPGHQGRRAAGRPERAAPAQRADGGGDRLWPGQRRRGPVRGLRPGRRHFRHLAAAR